MRKTQKQQASTSDAFVVSVGSAETSIAQTAPGARGVVPIAMELGVGGPAS